MLNPDAGEVMWSGTVQVSRVPLRRLAGLTAGTLDSERMRQRMQAVADDRDTAVAELWQLRDAGRDTYTPAEDALGELLPAAHRLNDVHAASWNAVAGGVKRPPTVRPGVPRPARPS